MPKETREIRRHLKANMDMRKRDIMLANFLGGLAWGFGSVFGATVVVALLLWLLSIINIIPIIGGIISGIIETVRQSQGIGF